MHGDAGSGQLDYLGYRGAIYLCGLTCFCRLGDPKGEVDLFILQAERPNRTRPGLEGRNWGWDQRGSDALSQRLELPAGVWVEERTRPRG